MKYIDADQIRAEIERQIEINKGLLDGQLKAGCLYAFHQILDFMGTLPEQPEDGLEEEMAEMWLEWCEDVDYLVYASIARHFYELGQQSCPKISDNSLEKEIDRVIADYSFTKTIDSGGFKTTVLDYAKIARHFAEWGMNQCPLPEDTTIFMRGVTEGKRLMMEEAVEGVARPDDCEIWVNLVGYGYKFKDGDKVKVIVIKEDEL